MRLVACPTERGCPIPRGARSRRHLRGDVLTWRGVDLAQRGFGGRPVIETTERRGSEAEGRPDHEPARGEPRRAPGAPACAPEEGNPHERRLLPRSSGGKLPSARGPCVVHPRTRDVSVAEFRRAQPSRTASAFGARARARRFGRPPVRPPARARVRRLNAEGGAEGLRAVDPRPTSAPYVGPLRQPPTSAPYVSPQCARASHARSARASAMSPRRPPASTWDAAWKA